MKDKIEEEGAIKYFDSIKKHDDLFIKKTESILQNYPIEGKVYFDSWDEKYNTLFVIVDNEPISKRFLIKASYVQIPNLESF